MTKEERLDWLCRLRSYLVQFGIPAKERSMFEKALSEEIEVLSTKPCEDCISRQEVLKLQYRIDDSATLSTRDVVNVEDIEDLPPVRPKSKTGQWIYKTIRGEKVPCCSVCGLSNGTYYEFKFCPNCGIRMAESEDEDE